jgi:hypothetical protein
VIHSHVSVFFPIITSSLPQVFVKYPGLALSGGGPRAALIGASMVHALDDRNPDAVRAGVSQSNPFVRQFWRLSWLTFWSSSDGWDHSTGQLCHWAQWVSAACQAHVAGHYTNTYLAALVRGSWFTGSWVRWPRRLFKIDLKLPLGHVI